MRGGHQSEAWCWVLAALLGLGKSCIRARFLQGRGRDRGGLHKRSSTGTLHKLPQDVIFWGAVIKTTPSSPSPIGEVTEWPISTSRLLFSEENSLAWGVLKKPLRPGPLGSGNNKPSSARWKWQHGPPPHHHHQPLKLFLDKQEEGPLWRWKGPQREEPLSHWGAGLCFYVWESLLKGCSDGGGELYFCL